MKNVPVHSPLWRCLKALYSPGRVISKLVECAPFSPFWLRCALDAFWKPAVAYGLVQAARQARALGISRIAALEFGVAQGRGLVELEELARHIGKHLGVEVQVYGFDLGTGLPPPADYRDCPYVWSEDQFAMDVDAVRAKLKQATLILGDVRETVPAFFDQYDPPCVGYISFDMDYYSSTAAAFQLFDTPKLDRFLPRTLCYFDDVIGQDYALHSRFDGELLAIDEFNDQHEDRKLARIHGLAAKRIAECRWAEQILVLHLFQHARYCDHVRDE